MKKVASPKRNKLVVKATSDLKAGAAAGGKTRTANAFPADEVKSVNADTK